MRAEKGAASLTHDAAAVCSGLLDRSIELRCGALAVPAAGALLEDASYVRVMETTRALRDRLESRI